MAGRLDANQAIKLSYDNTARRLRVTTAVDASGVLTAQTAAVGSDWAAFADQACNQLTISNQTGQTIEVRKGGAGAGFQIPTATLFTFRGITNANELEIRRVDQNNSQVTVSATWES